MLNWPLRIALVLWGLFFLTIGVQGVFMPQTLTETFAVTAANTVGVTPGVVEAAGTVPTDATGVDPAAPAVTPAATSTLSSMGVNTLRADMGAFFIVAALGALIGSLPRQRHWLLCSAALFGVALIGRIIGVTSGDVLDFQIGRAMFIEALSVALLVGGWYQLRKSEQMDAAAATAAAAPAATVPATDTEPTTRVEDVPAFDPRETRGEIL